MTFKAKSLELRRSQTNKNWSDESCVGTEPQEALSTRN